MCCRRLGNGDIVCRLSEYEDVGGRTTDVDAYEEFVVLQGYPLVEEVRAYGFCLGVGVLVLYSIVGAW